MKRASVSMGWVASFVIAAVAVVAACTGDAGPPGAQGAPGTPGAQGQQGVAGPAGQSGAGNGGDGGSAGEGGGGIVALSPRAQKGLAISPVALALDGKTPAEIEQIGQGSYFVNAVSACSDCHTSDPTKFLGGGTPFPIDGSNVVYTRNLTPDATGMTLTESAFIKSLRTGRDFSNAGTTLVVMPWAELRWLTTADLKSIYAYLKVIPAVANTVPADVKANSILTGAPGNPPTKYDEGAVTRLLPPEVDAQGGAVPDPDGVARGIATRALDAPTGLETSTGEYQATIGRGAYLVHAAQCNDCHTNPARNPVAAAPGYLKVNAAQYLTGGAVFPVPAPLEPIFHVSRSMSADLKGATNGFFNEPEDSLGRFLAVITSGTHSDESTDGEPARGLAWPMPWATFRNMETSDLAAIYTYVKSLPAITAANDKLTSDYAVYCTGQNDCDPSETCDTTAHECVGDPCTPSTVAGDCRACQTCTGTGNTKCVAPAAASACVTGGI